MRNAHYASRLIKSMLSTPLLPSLNSPHHRRRRLDEQDGVDTPVHFHVIRDLRISTPNDFSTSRSKT